MNEKHADQRHDTRHYVLLLTLFTVMLAAISIATNHAEAATLYEQENNNSFGLADALTIGDSIKGNLANSADVDYYKVTFTEKTYTGFFIYYPYAVSGSWNYTLIDSDQSTILFTYECKRSMSVYSPFSTSELGSETAYGFWFIGLKPGTYYIKISSGQYTNAQYLIALGTERGPQSGNLFELENNNTKEKAQAVEIDGSQSYEGTLSPRDVDWFKFTLKNEGTSLYASFKTHDYISYTIYDPNMKEITSETIQNRSVGRDLSWLPLPAGTYYIKVSRNVDQNTINTYELRINAHMKPNIAEEKISPIPDQIYTGRAIKPKVEIKIPVQLTWSHLTEGRDYTVTYKNNVKPGTATVIIKGIGNYTGTVTKTFKIISNSYIPGTVTKISIHATRIYGDNRYQTSYAIANQYKKKLGVSKFNAICVADGRNYPDTLAGAYLAKVKKAPILVTADAEQACTIDYIKKNLKPGGQVYILGGPGSVSKTLDTKLRNQGFRVKRLGGKDRYETNILILKEAKVTDDSFIVCTGTDYGDALSASATGQPLLLVRGNGLTASQKQYLRSIDSWVFYLIGDTKVITKGVQTDINNHGYTERITGSNVYERSLKIAETLFFDEEGQITLAPGGNFVDGLCGGPLAITTDGPLILCDSSAAVYKKIAAYARRKSVRKVTVLGGKVWISDQAARAIAQ